MRHPIHPRSWWEAHVEELKTMTPKAFSEAHDVSRGSVLTMRSLLGISKRVATGKSWRIDWTKADWSKHDAQIAREMDISREAVRLMRRRVGLPASQRPKVVKAPKPPPPPRGYWRHHLDDLRNLPVAEVAAKHGRSVKAAYGARRTWGITKAALLKTGPKAKE